MITEQDIVEHAMRQARRAFWTKVLVAQWLRPAFWYM